MQHDTFTLHFLLHSATLLEEQLRLRLTELDISHRQARILDALDRMGEASQAQLAREFDLTPASMSTMTVRLLQAGFISRARHPDEARSNVLQLSEKGRSLLSEVRNAWADVDRMIEAKIGQEKAEQLAALTRELRDALGGRVPGQASHTGRGKAVAAGSGPGKAI
ncbi:MarR family winged helix-turn-helix transcriptional regulator [Hoeflea sp.]|uniref:MarR family winged helix-turn-helix transcriptional regulator n=1 Tax=Hoeflea sp. TaxID=1940281 RepID=UPI003A8EF719